MVFGTTWLVVTPSILCIANADRVIIRRQLDTIKEIRVDELAGGGRLSAVGIDTVVTHLIQYTNHFVPHFAVAARAINNVIAKRVAELPEPQKSGFCVRCGAPLPDRDTTCPRIKILSRILSLTFPYKSKVIWLMIVTALSVSFQVVPPYLTKLIVDDVIGKGHHDRLTLYIGAMVGTGILFVLMRLINIWLTAWISAQIVGDLRATLHTVLQYLKLTFFNKREPGEVTGRIMHDTGELLQFLVEGMPFLLINSLLFVAIGGILIKINRHLAIFVFVPVPLLIFGGKWFWSKLTPLFARQGSIIGHMHTMLTESLQGLRVVKAFSQEKRSIGQYEKLNKRLAGTYIGIHRIFGSFKEVMFWIMNLGVAMVWFFAVRMITGENPKVTLGDLLAFVGYIWLFYGPLQWFSVVLNWMSHAFSGAERIF